MGDKNWTASASCSLPSSQFGYLPSESVGDKGEFYDQKISLGTVLGTSWVFLQLVIFIFLFSGSVIVRCYPFKSDYYMNIVYELIRNSISAVNQFARTHFAGDISPILLQTYNVYLLFIFLKFFNLGFLTYVLTW